MHTEGFLRLFTVAVLPLWSPVFDLNLIRCGRRGIRVGLYGSTNIVQEFLIHAEAQDESEERLSLTGSCKIEKVCKIRWQSEMW